jgi:hypothetical protein
MTRNSEDSGGAERVGVVGPWGFRLNKELDAESGARVWTRRFRSSSRLGIIIPCSHEPFLRSLDHKCQDPYFEALATIILSSTRRAISFFLAFLFGDSPCQALRQEAVAVTQRAQITRRVRRGVSAPARQKGVRGRLRGDGQTMSSLSPTHSKPVTSYAPAVPAENSLPTKIGVGTEAKSDQLR